MKHQLSDQADQIKTQSAQQHTHAVKKFMRILNPINYDSYFVYRLILPRIIQIKLTSDL